MIIRGILDNSLNGQLCIRGFAPIKELDRISTADYSYQRNPLEEHEAEILDFLDKEPYLFFPEIILSYKIKHDFSKSKDGETPIFKIQSRKSYTSKVDKTKIIVKPHDYKTFDAAGKNTLTVVEVTFNDATLNTAILNNDFPFHRIDGNHRLSAARSSETSKVRQMVAPFCILLGQEFYTRGELTSDKTTETFDKSVKVFFHNINTKTTPLSSEENMKVIIDDEGNFPPDELESILGKEGLKTRELIKKVNPEIFTGIEHILSKQYRTYYIDVFRRLLEKGENPDKIVNKVFESLKAVDQLYKDSDKLKGNSSFGLLTAFLYYHVENNKAKYNFFRDWVMKNNIFEIHEITVGSIIKIFEKINDSKQIKVFVAMPYYSDEEVNDYNKLFKEVLAEIQSKAKSGISINLIPIMRFRGESKRIDRRLLDEIKACDIFIADLSTCNENVCFEIAYAEGREKPMLIIKSDRKQPPFDMDKLQYIPFQRKTYFSSIKKIISNNLPAILSEKFGVHF